MPGAGPERALKPFEEAIAQAKNPALENKLATRRAYYLVESRRWSQVKGRDAFANVDELFAIAFAAAKLRDLDRAEAARAVLERIAASDQNLDAAPLDQQFLANFRNTDAGLPEIKEARAYLAANPERR